MSALSAVVFPVPGPPVSTLNGLLSAADLIDELNLSISPQVVGGDGPRLTHDAPPIAHRMQLAHVLEHDGFLFTRYVRDRDASS